MHIFCLIEKLNIRETYCCKLSYNAKPWVRLYTGTKYFNKIYNIFLNEMMYIQYWNYIETYFITLILPLILF